MGEARLPEPTDPTESRPENGLHEAIRIVAKIASALRSSQ
jgi:hypothetical protein